MNKQTARAVRQMAESLAGKFQILIGTVLSIVTLESENILVRSRSVIGSMIQKGR